MTSDLVRGHLDTLLLAVLADGPGHGYELGRRLTERSDGVLGVAEGSLYPALKRLEGRRLVTSAWDEDGARRRRVYRLTGSGRRAVGAAGREWRDFATAVDRVLGSPA